MRLPFTHVSRVSTSTISEEYPGVWFQTTSQDIRESNSGLRFWRPQCFRNTYILSFTEGYGLRCLLDYAPAPQNGGEQAWLRIFMRIGICKGSLFHRCPPSILSWACFDKLYYNESSDRLQAVGATFLKSSRKSALDYGVSLLTLLGEFYQRRFDRSPGRWRTLD